MKSEIVPIFLTEEDCYQILKKYREFEFPVRIVEHKIVKANDKVIGFLGDYFRLKIFYETDSKHGEMVCFLKTEPIFNENQRNFVQDCGVFKKESFIYENILPKLMKIAGFNFAPRSFLTKRDVIVLEDLKCRNFEAKRTDYTLAECRAMMDCLAHFHCSSIIFEELNSSAGKPFDIGTEYGDELPEGALNFTEGSLQYKWLKTVTNCVIDFWKTLPGYDDEDLRQKLERFVFGGELEELIKPSKRFRNVLTHNDLWGNNLMLNKYQKCIIIDFQLMRYTPPACDIIMALFSNNSFEFLEKHFNNMLDQYYSTFCNLLKKYHLESDSIFPRDKFLESIEVYKLPSLIEAAATATNVFLPEDRHAYIMGDCKRYEDFCFGTRSRYNLDIFENDSAYRKKLLGIILPLAHCLRKR